MKIKLLLIFIIILLSCYIFLRDNSCNLLPTNHLVISDIVQAPRKFNNKTVTVSGIVKNGFGIVGKGMYQLDDGSGSIVVVTNKSIPNNGDSIMVTGMVNQAMKIGSRQLIVIREVEK